MRAKSNGETKAKLLLTAKQRRQLTKLLYEAQPQGPHYKALQRIDRLASKFYSDIQSLGFRPHAELIDQCLGSKFFQRKFVSRRRKLSPAERKVDNAGIDKAEKLLRRLVRNVARNWKAATGQPLPALEAHVIEWGGYGYRPRLTAFAANHPLWLILDALMLKLSAFTVGWLVIYARKREGENIEYPDLLEMNEEKLSH
jgi:hypothetical protein